MCYTRLRSCTCATYVYAKTSFNKINPTRDGAGHRGVGHACCTMDQLASVSIRPRTHEVTTRAIARRRRTRVACCVPGTRSWINRRQAQLRRARGGPDSDPKRNRPARSGIRRYVLWTSLSSVLAPIDCSFLLKQTRLFFYDPAVERRIAFACATVAVDRFVSLPNMRHVMVWCGVAFRYDPAVIRNGSASRKVSNLPA